VIKTEQLYYLTQIAKYNSLSKAADALYMTKSALSLSMKQLEEECGYEIIERTYRGVRLTEKGQQALKLAEQVLGALGDLVAIGKEDATVEKKYNLVIDRSCMRLLSNKLFKPRSKVLEQFNIVEQERIGMGYDQYLAEDTILLSIMFSKNREILENDERIDVRYLYASKQYPASSKNTKWIKENVKAISKNDFLKLPKVKLKAPYDFAEENIVLLTDDSAIVAKAIENDYGVGLVTKFAPDVYCFDHSNMKIYEPFDEEVYITMITMKQEKSNVMFRLEHAIKE